MEVAVFQVGAMRCALPASALMEAVSPDELVRTPNADGLMLGLLEAKSSSGPRLVHVMCARRRFGVLYKARATDGIVLVLRSPHRPDVPALGLRVDDVLAVVEVDQSHLQEAPGGFQSFAPWVSGLLPMEVTTTEGNESVLVQWLDVDWLASHVRAAGVASERIGEQCTLAAVG
jgi:chemotaxis signal transduction protein